jgi:hypothetical protein
MTCSLALDSSSSAALARARSLGVSSPLGYQCCVDAARFQHRSLSEIGLFQSLISWHTAEQNLNHTDVAPGPCSDTWCHPSQPLLSFPVASSLVLLCVLLWASPAQAELVSGRLQCLCCSWHRLCGPHKVTLVLLQSNA